MDRVIGKLGDTSKSKLNTARDPENNLLVRNGDLPAKCQTQTIGTPEIQMFEREQESSLAINQNPACSRLTNEAYN